MTENFLFSGDAFPKIKWSTIRAMGYSSKFWGNSLSTLQLHGWLGRGLYPCCILAFLDWNFSKNQRIFYCNRLSCLLGCTIKSKPSLAPKKFRTLTFQLKKKKKSEILHCIQDGQQLDKSKEKKEKNVKERPAQNELHEFLSKLNQSENNPGILQVIPGFANNFQPKSLDLSEQMLTNLYDAAHTTLPCDKLLGLVRKLMQS